MIKLRLLLIESRLDRLYVELNHHVRDYNDAKKSKDEWAMEDSKKNIMLLAAEIKKERAKSPEDLDRDAFLKHHYTGHIGSNVYRQYQAEGGLGWLGSKSKYPILLHRGKYGPFDVEFRQSGETSVYCKNDADGNLVRDEKGNPVYMTPEEVKSAGLPDKDTMIVAFVNDKPVGLASNEFGAVGVWVEGPYQRVGIGTDLMAMHIEQRPRIKAGIGKIGQATDAGISLMKAYHRKMAKKHGMEWFQKLKVSSND